VEIMKARDGSLLAKYAAGAMLVVGTALVGVGLLPGLTVKDLAIAAFALAGIFGTVDLNLLLEKIFGSRRSG
jgi:hypothetical protein